MGRFWLLLLVLLAGACSMRSAVEAMTSPADRAYAREVVDRLRGGDQAWLRQEFDAELWAQSAKQLSSVPEMFPSVAGETEITGFSTSTNLTNGISERSRDFTLVTHGGGRWTVTSFRTYSRGGPDRIVQWQVMPHESEPPELAMLNAVDSALPWFWGILLALVVGFTALIAWLVRRSRRKQGVQTGTP